MSKPAAAVVAIRGSFVLTALVGISDLLWHLGRGPLSVGMGMASGVLGDAGPSGLTRLPFETSLTALCAAAVLVGWAWISLGVVVVVARTVLDATITARAGSEPGRSALERCCPQLTRRLVIAACGVAIGTGVCAPAIADPAGQADPSAVARRVGVTGLALPDRVVGRAVARRMVTVAPGDSLWVIAERSLPPDAKDHEINVAWHEIVRANVRRIGADPDLIFAGTRLVLPPLKAHATTFIKERTRGERTS